MGATDGYFAIRLPATDDPDVNPTNFTYNVSEPTGRTYNILVPKDTPLLNKPGDPLNGQPVIELSDVVPAPGPSAGLVQLARGRGLDSITVESGNWVAHYDDGATQIIGPAPTGGGGSYTDEQARDAVGAALRGTEGASVTLDDDGDTITIRSKNKLATLDDVTTTGAAVGKVPAVTAVDGQGVPSFGLVPPADARVPRIRVPRRGMAFLGDSITAYNSSIGNSWHRLLCFLTGQSLRHVGFFATGGFTLAQIQATHLPQVLALDPLPGAVVIAGGTNDVGSGAFDFAASRATHQAITTSLLNAGIMPVFWTVPPRDDSATANGAVGRWNAYIREYAARLGVPVVDAWSALVNPTTGLYQAALKLDDIHPNALGHVAIAQRMAADSGFTGRFSDGRPILTGAVVDGANLVPNGYGLFVTDSNSDGRSDGWSSFGSGPTYSIVTGDSSIRGNWQRASFAGASTAGGGLQYDVTGVVPGRTYLMAARLRATLDPAADCQVNLSGGWRDASAAITGSTTLTTGALLRTSGELSGVVYGVGVAPVGADRLRISAQAQRNGGATAAVSFDIAQVTVTDLTDSGF